MCEGWVCPRCGRSLAPAVLTCPHCPPRPARPEPDREILEGG